MAEPDKPAPTAAPATTGAAQSEKTPSPAAPAAAKPAAPPAPPAAKPEPVKPMFQIYNRQKDQHVVGPGCWCLPKVEVVDGKRIIVHKRD